MDKTYLGKIRILKKDFLPEIRSRNFYLPVCHLYQNRQNINKVICEININGKTIPAVYKKNDNRLAANFDVYKSLKLILNETLFEPSMPLYSKLPFHYHLIPGEIRKKIFYFLYGKQGVLIHQLNKKKFPDWPIDYSVYFLKELLKITQSRQQDLIQQIYLPKRRKYTLCLTHDVDTKGGFEKINDFVKVERSLGFFSTFYIPAFHYDIDFDLLKILEKEGFEIGIHGYNHDGKLPFLNLSEIDDKLKKSVDKFKRHVKIYGFRSPSFLRTPNLYKVLEKYFLYDSSAPDTLNLDLQTSFDGCASVFPYKRGKILEIPITVPDEADLLMYGYKPEQILKIWWEKINFIRKVGGVAIILTHTDPHFSGNEIMLKFYQRFLKEVKADDTCFVTLCKDLI